MYLPHVNLSNALNPLALRVPCIPITESPWGRHKRKSRYQTIAAFLLPKFRKSHVNSSFNPAINKTKANTFLMAFAE